MNYINILLAKINHFNSKMAYSNYLDIRSFYHSTIRALNIIFVSALIGSMLEQVRNLVVIKISVVTISVALFILMLKIIFTCVKIVAHAALWHYLGTYNLDFRHENNSTPGVLIEKIR